MPPERRETVLSYALICFGVGAVAFAYVAHKSIGYVLHPNAFGGIQLSDVVLTRVDLASGVQWGWLFVLLGTALVLWTLPVRARRPGLLVVGTLLVLVGIVGILYSLQGWNQISHHPQQWDGLGVLAIYPWIGLSCLSIFILLAGVLLAVRVMLVWRDHAEGARLPR